MPSINDKVLTIEDSKKLRKDLNWAKEREAVIQKKKLQQRQEHNNRVLENWKTRGI